MTSTCLITKGLTNFCFIERWYQTARGIAPEPYDQYTSENLPVLTKDGVSDYQQVYCLLMGMAKAEFTIYSATQP